MTYDPVAYWNRRGRVYERRFVPARYAAQEAALREVLAALPAPASVIDVGCGFGRLADLVAEVWPEARYTGLDQSASMLARAHHHHHRRTEFIRSPVERFRTTRRWDVAVAAEVLMHVPPDRVRAAVARLLALAPVVVTVDWTEPVDGAAEHNFRHDYAALFAGHAVQRRAVGLQTIHVVRAAA